MDFPKLMIDPYEDLRRSLGFEVWFKDHYETMIKGLFIETSKCFEDEEEYDST